MNNIDYKPDFIRTDANHYDAKLIDNGRRRHQGQRLHPQRLLPVRGGQGRYPATKQYLDAFAAVHAGRQEPRRTSASRPSRPGCCSRRRPRSAANDLTRKCVYDNAKKVTSWTGGGLHADAEPGRRARRRRASPSSRRRRTGSSSPTCSPNDGIFQLQPEEPVHSSRRLRARASRSRTSGKHRGGPEVAGDVGRVVSHSSRFPNRAATGPTGRPWTSS